jgi:hypothetical protein
MKTAILSALALVALGQAAACAPAQADFYVAPGGSDRASGTFAKPFI